MTGETSFKISSPTTLPSPETSFPLFSYLPTELQFKIWLAALPPSRIVEVFYAPSRNLYVSNNPPPVTFSICHASRQVAKSHYQNLRLGDSPLPIPFDFANDKLYVSFLPPIISTHCPIFLYDLAVSPCRHVLRSLFLDMRAFNKLCDNGLLIIVAGMNRLDELGIVTEYGRSFRGEARFVDCPLSRSDLIGLTERVAGELYEAKRRVVVTKRLKGNWDEIGEESKSEMVRIKSVFLTRGGQLV
jgi:hypothetical protein